MGNAPDPNQMTLYGGVERGGGSGGGGFGDWLGGLIGGGLGTIGDWFRGNTPPGWNPEQPTYFTPGMQKPVFVPETPVPVVPQTPIFSPVIPVNETTINFPKPTPNIPTSEGAQLTPVQLSPLSPLNLQREMPHSLMGELGKAPMSSSVNTSPMQLSGPPETVPGGQAPPMGPAGAVRQSMMPQGGAGGVEPGLGHALQGGIEMLGGGRPSQRGPQERAPMPVRGMMAPPGMSPIPPQMMPGFPFRAPRPLIAAIAANNPTLVSNALEPRPEPAPLPQKKRRRPPSGLVAPPEPRPGTDPQLALAMKKYPQLAKGAKVTLKSQEAKEDYRPFTRREGRESTYGANNPELTNNPANPYGPAEQERQAREQEIQQLHATISQMPSPEDYLDQKRAQFRRQAKQYIDYNNRNRLQSMKYGFRTLHNPRMMDANAMGDYEFAKFMQGPGSREYQGYKERVERLQDRYDTLVDQHRRAMSDREDDIASRRQSQADNQRAESREDAEAVRKRLAGMRPGPEKERVMNDAIDAGLLKDDPARNRLIYEDYDPTGASKEEERQLEMERKRQQIAQDEIMNPLRASAANMRNIKAEYEQAGRATLDHLKRERMALDNQLKALKAKNGPESERLRLEQARLNIKRTEEAINRVGILNEKSLADMEDREGTFGARSTAGGAFNPYDEVTKGVTDVDARQKAIDTKRAELDQAAASRKQHIQNVRNIVKRVGAETSPQQDQRAAEMARKLLGTKDKNGDIWTQARIDKALRDAVSGGQNAGQR